MGIKEFIKTLSIKELDHLLNRYESTPDHFDSWVHKLRNKYANIVKKEIAERENIC